MNERKLLPYFTFSDDEMLDYLRQLVPIELKYNLHANDPADPLFSEKARLLYRIARFEETLESVNGKVSDADKLHKMLQLVYGEAEPIGKFVEIVQLVREKLIAGVISIEGMKNLFNCKYFGYEWLLHMEIDEEKQSYKPYRDHFIHQVKDAYSMVRLLEELPKFTEVLMGGISGSNASVNAYLERQASRMMHSLNDTRSRRRIYLGLAELRLREEEREYINKSQDDIVTVVVKQMMNDLDLVEKLPGKEREQAKIHTKLREFMKLDILHNIMVEALLISGLFHDIGYPIRYALARRNELADMVPTAHFFIESMEHFTEIKGLLSNSLLFNTVDLDVIEAALKDNVHGAFSAVAFLLYFYENGAIQNMDPLDRAAVEVAALSIFDHTIEYSVIDDDPSKYRYHHAVFTRNPMSYLLRFTDDIQEWGRVYFNIKKNRSLRICEHCHMPIVECGMLPLREDPLHHAAAPTKIWGRGDDMKNYPGMADRIYVCGCAKKDVPKETQTDTPKRTETLGDLWDAKRIQAKHGKFPPDDAFSLLPDIEYRKINHIKTCLRVRFHHCPKSDNRVHDPANLLFLPNYMDDLTDEPPHAPVVTVDTPIDRLLLHIDYDPFKVLQTALIDSTFPKYLSKSLNKVRKLSRNQLQFASFAIYAGTTNNPFILKTRILENFLNDWHVRFAKAERLWFAMEHREAYSLERSVFLRFLTCADSRNIGDEISGRVGELLDIRKEVRETLEKAAGMPKVSSPDDVLKLRIFMLLSENPRWGIDEIEGTPSGDRPGEKLDYAETLKAKRAKRQCVAKQAMTEQELLDDARDNYLALYEKLKTARYEPSRIMLREAENFTALLRIADRMRRDFSDRNRLRACYDAAGDRYIPDTAALRGDFGTLSGLIVEQTSCEAGANNMDLAGHLKLYATLLLSAKYLNALGELIPTKAIKEIAVDNVFEAFPLVKKFADYALFGDSVRALLADFFKQETSHICYARCLKGQRRFPEEYCKIYKIDGPAVNAVARYCRNENYLARFQHGDMADAYSDLYMFYCLSHI